MLDDLPSRLAKNLRHLRTARGLTQAQVAKLASLPRATWANLESGTANPTLGVLHRVAFALQVPIEEIVAAQRTGAKHYPRGTLPERRRGGAILRSLLPDPVPGVLIERIELPAGVRMTGVPHTPGTREYLTCEAGEIELVASGESWRLGVGDVLVFRGDQRHSYGNVGGRAAVGYSVVLLQPVA